ncbi:MAG: Xaa-Pro peptidase family protein [Sulfolobales archaeon]
MIKLNKLDELMESKKLDYILLCGQPNITYFTNVVKPSGCLLFMEKGGSVEILTPLLEYERISKQVSSDVVRVLPYSTYKIGYEEVIHDPLTYIKDKSSKAAKIGIDLGYVTYSTYKLIKSIEGKVIDINDDILNFRSIKDEHEINFIENALRISEDALLKLMDELNCGITELQAVGLLEKFMRYLGAEGVAFDTIVASGVNTSYPHAIPGTKVIGCNEHVVVDLGAVYHSYASDLTRTLLREAIGEVARIFDAVEHALSVAEDYVGPYMKASEVDGRIREILTKYGLNKYFIHSSGHGLGIEVHEMPRIAQGVDTELRPGMVITLEPGVYIKGLFGVRIEDLLTITKSGVRILNRLGHRI